MKRVVLSNDNYEMFIEMHEGCWFFHVDVYKWTPEVKKSYLEDIEKVHQVFQPLFAIPEDTGDKMEKFGKVTGFKVIGHHTCVDGVERKVFQYKGVK